MNAAERDLVVRLTPDPSALLEFLDTAAGALITAADTLRAAYPVPEAPVDRTGMCDHCDKPQTGGAAGGGISPEHWCDDHRPADWPGSPDTDAPEPWTPKVGDRVITAPAKSTTFVEPGTVIDVRHRGDTPLVWVRLDSGPGARIFYVDELIPLVDEPPATVGPERLTDTARSLGCICGECRSQREFVADHVRDRLAQYPADATVAQVYADWFGSDAS